MRSSIKKIDSFIFFILILLSFSCMQCGDKEPSPKPPDIEAFEKISSIDPEAIGVTQSPTSFIADNSILSIKGNSYWFTETLAPGYSNPINTRATLFWGLPNPKSCGTWGKILRQENTSNNKTYYPTCNGNSKLYGPSFEADKLLSTGYEHVLHTESRSTGNGFFLNYGSQGQSGVNKYLSPTYTEFSPNWFGNTSTKPWGASLPAGANPNNDPKLRTAIISEQRVTSFLTTGNTSINSDFQLQQVISLSFINIGDCSRDPNSPRFSKTYCQIQFNLKSFMKGRQASLPNGFAEAYSDPAQGGVIAIIGPINFASKATPLYLRSSSNPEPRPAIVDGKNVMAWTSWGLATQNNLFSQNLNLAASKFQVEISWPQFLSILKALGADTDTRLFGTDWNNRDKWLLLGAGYGQEVYNTNSTAKVFLEGYFKNLKVLGLYF